MTPMLRWWLAGLGLLGFSLTIGWLAMKEPTLFADHPRPLEAVPDSAAPTTLPRSVAMDMGPVAVVGFGHVDIEGGTTPLVAPAPGQVLHLLCKEGDHVKSGQVLIELDAAQAKAQLAAAESAVKEARIKLDQAGRAPADHASRVEQQTQSVAAAQRRLDAQRRQAERLEKLHETVAVAEENLQTARDRVAELQASVAVEQSRLEQLKLDHPQDQLALAQAGLASAEARLAMARDLVDRHSLRAPDDGMILRVLVSKGQMVGGPTQGPSIWFCADRPRIIRCEIDQEFADRVMDGQSVEIVDDLPGGKRWTGRVLRAGDWIATRRSMLDEPFQKNDVRTLECLVAIDPNQASVRIGQRMRVILHRTGDRPPSPAVAGAVSQTPAR